MAARAWPRPDGQWPLQRAQRTVWRRSRQAEFRGQEPVATVPDRTVQGQMEAPAGRQQMLEQAAVPEQVPEQAVAPEQAPGRRQAPEQAAGRQQMPEQTVAPE